jgi:hypothetical protein
MSYPDNYQCFCLKYSVAFLKAAMEEQMKKRKIQRIAIGMVIFFILALIGLNIYEYRKVVRASETTDSEASIRYNLSSR